MKDNEKHRLKIRDELTDFLLYTTPDGQVKVEVLLHDKTIWLPQKRIASLFGVGTPAISKHLENIYSSGELQRDSTVSILETVQQEGHRQVKRKVEFYNLDAIISVSYRVNSSRPRSFASGLRNDSGNLLSRVLFWMMSGLKASAISAKTTQTSRRKGIRRI